MSNGWQALWRRAAPRSGSDAGDTGGRVGQQIPLDWFLDREDHPYLENSGQSRSESSKKGNGQDSQELKAPKL
jgi:hypothetical protein